MSDIYYDSSAEFNLALSDIANQNRHCVPLSSDEFFTAFLSDSGWEIIAELEPDSVYCPHCNGPVTSDGLLGWDCPTCGQDVIG